MNVLLIVLSFLFTDVSAALICSNYKPSSSYTLMKQSLNGEIEKFSDKESIAQSADVIFKKLMAAKSPFISSWYKKGNFNSKTEVEVAKAWRQYYARNFLLMKYPQDPKIDNEIEILVDTELSKYFSAEYKQKLEKLFDRSKELAAETINELSIPQKKLIIERIKSIKLYWPQSLKTSRNNSMPLDLLEWGIAYDPIPNEINIGLNSLIYSSDENYLAVFAHEIGHSFDSCRWGAFFDGPWPFNKVGECLRSDKSVSAKKRDDSLLEQSNKSGKISAELMAALKSNPTCNKMAYPPTGVQADQLPETFADWFSAEVVSHMKDLNVTNLRTDLCEEKNLIAGSSYVSNQMRQEKIYFVHPKINKLLKMGDSHFSPVHYCAFGP